MAIFRRSRRRSGNGRDSGASRQQSPFLCSLSAPFVDFRTPGPGRAVSNDFAVDAIHFLRGNPAPGPLYNNLNCGGFRMWYLPELPVSIDGRNEMAVN